MMMVIFISMIWVTCIKITFNCNLFDLETLMKNKEHDDGYYALKSIIKSHMNQSMCHQHLIFYQV